MTFELEITKVVPPGDGFGIHRNKAVFVPAATTGDVVRVSAVKETKEVIFAALEEVLQAAPDRIEAPCPHYMQCGGCSLMHLSYEHQLALKKQMLVETFASHQFQIDPEVVPSPQSTGFRYRSQLQIRSGEVGFSRRKGNQIVHPAECQILSPGLMEALPKMATLQVADGECLLLESFAEGTVSGVLELGAEQIPLPGYPDSIMENYGFGNMALPVAAFAQSNPYVTVKITEELLDFCRDAQQVVELYCGCGTFSMPVGARVESLIGYDSGELAIQTARENAQQNHLEKIRFKTTNLDRLGKLPKADTIIVDPPRKGMGKRVTQLIGRSKAKAILYISCNPATQSRDINLLHKDHGFTLTHIAGYDMYCHSTHLETVAVLTR